MWIGAWIKKQRKAAGYGKQKDFAACLGISAAHLSDIERGARDVTAELAMRISAAFKIDPALVLLRAGILPEEALGRIEGQPDDSTVIAAYGEFIARLRD